MTARKSTVQSCPLCSQPTKAKGLCSSCVDACRELEVELDEMEAKDPKLKAAGDRLRDLEAALRGEPSSLTRVHRASSNV